MIEIRTEGRKAANVPGSSYVVALANRICFFGYVELLPASERVLFYRVINEVEVVVATRHVDDNAFELNW